MKTQVTLYLNSEILELMRLRYSGKISNLTEAYWKGLINSENTENYESVEEQEERELNELIKTESELKLKKKIILERRKLRESEAEQLKAKENTDFVDMWKRDNPLRHM